MAEQFYGLTDTGKQRSNNEDTFIIQPTADKKFIIACVIDGVGGYSGGEVAAYLARKIILQCLSKPTGDITAILIDCFNKANQAILEEKQRDKEHKDMACVATLALIDIEENQFYYAHVGDTRLYLQRDGSLIKISHDQSFVGYLEESRRISEEEAMLHPKRNEINKALGFEVNLAKDSEYIETGQSPFLPGDLLLLCSDGLTDMVSTADITKITTRSSSLKDRCVQLIDAANANGGADNVTVVLIANTKQSPQYDPTRPLSSQKKTVLQTDEEIVRPVVKRAELTAVTPKQPDSSAWLVTVLSILVLILVAGNVWQYLESKKTANVIAVAVNKEDTLASGPLQIKLENAITNLKGNLLLLDDVNYPSPIKISTAINITRDTLFIKTKGNITLIADSAYKGAGLALSSKCKLVMLDSLTLKNFGTGIIAYNNVLKLKNVKFDGCTVSVQNMFAFPANSKVVGSIYGLTFDSTAVKN